MDLGRVLKGCLCPTTPQLKPQCLTELCLRQLPQNENLLTFQFRTAAVYVTTSLYDFHERQAGLLEVAGHGGIQAEIQENMWDEVLPIYILYILHQSNILREVGFDVVSLPSRFSLCLTNTSSNSSQFICTSASSTRLCFKNVAPYGNNSILPGALCP